MHSTIIAQLTTIQETTERMLDDYQRGRPIGHHIDVIRATSADMQLMLRDGADAGAVEPPFSEPQVEVGPYPAPESPEAVSLGGHVAPSGMVFGPFNSPMMQLLGGGQPAPPPEYRLPLQIAAAREIMGSFMKLRSFIANAGPQQDDMVPGDEWKGQQGGGTLSEDEEKLYNSSLTTLRTWLEGLSEPPE